MRSAWPGRPPQTADRLADYVADTLEFTRRLTQWPHKQFISLSTAEVYPARGHSGSEEEPIELNALRNLYGACKLMAESIVQAHAHRALILRSTGLLGPAARPSSLIRILTEDRPSLTLAAERNLTGIYNLSSSKSVTLGEVAEKFRRRVNWGNYNYDVGHVDNRKIAGFFRLSKKPHWR